MRHERPAAAAAAAAARAGRLDRQLAGQQQFNPADRADRAGRAGRAAKSAGSTIHDSSWAPTTFRTGPGACNLHSIAWPPAEVDSRQLYNCQHEPASGSNSSGPTRRLAEGAERQKAHRLWGLSRSNRARVAPVSRAPAERREPSAQRAGRVSSLEWARKLIVSG